MNRRISLGAAISFMAVVAAITFTITMILSLNIFNDKVYNVKEREELYKKVAEIDHIIRQNYVGELDETYLLDQASNGFVGGTKDPYAAYYDASTYSRRQAIASGKLVGIGAGLSRDESGYFRVSNAYQGSPAEQAGLHQNDLIIAVDGQDVKTAGYSKANNLLMGDPGTSVTLTIRRESVDSDVTVLRKNFDLPVVTMTMMGTNAYIRITGFTASAVQQFQNIMNTITANRDNVTGIILDVRGTNSGSLDYASDMLDMLLPSGDLYTASYKDGTTNLIRRSDANEVALPMITLVNSKTQYAAELFAADLRDYGKSKLVGVTTFGQGVMQKEYQLKDGSCVVLSNAQFNPAVSANFDGVGLAPDYELALTVDDEKKFSYNQLPTETDSQLTKAAEVLNASK